MVHKFEIIIIKLLYKLLMLFPENSRYNFGGFLGKLAYKYINSRREITYKNLKIAFPEKSEEELEKIAKKSFEIIGKTFLAGFWTPNIIETDKVKIKNKKLLDDIYNKNKGVILVGLHMGNIEANLKLAKYYKTYDVIRRQKNPYLDDFINNNRRKTGINLIYKGKTTIRELIKAIKNKNLISLFSDHYDSGGIELDFFGKPTRMSTGAITIALKYNAPIVLFFNTLNEDNTSTIHIKKEFILFKTGNLEKDIILNMKRIIKEYENIIREYPEQWMWLHKRWR
ncbi:KDO2-lipid IV(A) lauroyltransferase [Hypnocyclicus thermotrophus]|uniref:KDO2-lipid IV(A) lauroyltransferase n=1 Tax=Hypnocyclicus thermotrophus TaxID=1627895 RepID=A0AA46DZ63_9FUSO|nr:lysophospholipid acyltransferase family protein [Hypnocyclicus thermotrophus]TDT71421.1 KDO2-lipid IV(A) lauroyltransferase [Hypnocyclicus thermotrophus]